VQDKRGRESMRSIRSRRTRIGALPWQSVRVAGVRSSKRRSLSLCRCLALPAAISGCWKWFATRSMRRTVEHQPSHRPSCTSADCLRECHELLMKSQKSNGKGKRTMSDRLHPLMSRRYSQRRIRSAFSADNNSVDRRKVEPSSWLQSHLRRLPPLLSTRTNDKRGVRSWRFHGCYSMRFRSCSKRQGSNRS
jgi:hypothetical protein